MLAGLLIGAITCYQILFTEIMDRLKQYAVLKAMGFTDGFLRRIILEQALLLSCGGFAVGAVATVGVYAYIAKETFLAVQLSAYSRDWSCDGGFMSIVAALSLCAEWKRQTRPNCIDVRNRIGRAKHIDYPKMRRAAHNQDCRRCS